jgi:hypothetical protein
MLTDWNTGIRDIFPFRASILFRIFTLRERSEVLSPGNKLIKNYSFGDVTPYSLVDCYQRFGGTYCLRHHTLKTEENFFSETLVIICQLGCCQKSRDLSLNLCVPIPLLKN